MAVRCVNCGSTNTYTTKVTLKEYFDFSMEIGSRMRNGPMVPFLISPVMLLFGRFGRCRDCNWMWPTLRK